MGKGKRIKQRRTPPHRRTVIVNACEIGHRDGMLAMRVGEETTAPTCIAIPVATAAGLVGHLHTASIDAEETYWQALPVALRGVDPPGDVDASTAAMRTFLLRQDWAGVLRRVPGDADDLFLVSHAGHVGLAIAPPFTHHRTLAVFDPLQLRRLGPALQRALAAARANVAPIVTPDTVAAVLEFLASRPWPVDEHPDPTPEQARTYMLQQHRDYLTREPYLRPEANNVPAG